MLEAQVEKRLKSGVKKLGGRCWKWSSPGRRGVPDCIVLLPTAFIDFVELKKAQGTTRKQQDLVHSLLRRLGFNVVVLNGPDDVDLYLQTLSTRMHDARSH